MHNGWRGRARSAVVLTAVLAAALVVATCEGSNLFEDQVVVEVPEVDILAPTNVNVAEPFSVSVRARSSAGLDEIRIVYTGAILSEEVFALNGQVDTTVTTVLQIATLPINPLLTVTAKARDRANRESSSRVVTIQVN